MAVPVIMPKQGQSVESCIITKWNKKVGDSVAVGDVIFSYETDKSSFEEEAKVSGVMLATFFEEGDDVECLTNVCVIGNAGENFAEFVPGGSSDAPAAPAVFQPKTETAPIVKEAPVKEGFFPVIMPKQGQSVESCIITKWNKKVGDIVTAGDVIFSYETDKASFEEEAKVSGTLLAVFFEEGDDVECLINVCVIGPAGGDASGYNPNNTAVAVADNSSVEVISTANPSVTSDLSEVAVARNPEDKLKISPRAKNAAGRVGVNPNYALGTGPGGRIIERDIVSLVDNKDYATFAAAAEKAPGMVGTGIGGRVSTSDLNTIDVEAKVTVKAETAPAAATNADYVDEPLTNMRKVISKAMLGSLNGMAQLTLNSSFDATDMLSFRKKIKASAEKFGFSNITITDMILFAVSRTLLNHKYVNANLIDDKTMRFFKNANVGLAVDTPRGLLVPTIFDANNLSLNEISVEAKKLAGAAQAGTISPDYLKGGSFTVTNLGTFGIESFTPVINPPQTCILGVNNTITRVKEVNGEIKTYPALGLSLTFDHRALDGAPAARFLKELVENLENISALLIK